MNQHEARFPIGTVYVNRLKRVCRIVDILKTYNSANELVRVRYISEHDFLGQKVIEHDVCDTTIARALAERPMISTMNSPTK